MTTLVPSPMTLNQGKILQNIDTCFKGLTKVLDSKKVIHIFLIFNEIALEKRYQLDIKMNHFLALKFENENDLNVMVEDVKQDEVHLASKATMGTIGILSGNSWIYGGHPILVSGTCKKENAIAHAKLIQTAINEVNSKKGKIPFQNVSIAPYEEAKQGKALVELMLKYHLSQDSPLYPLLSPFKFMNFFVGEDDLTAYKDWKHVTFKHLCNLILREQGIMVNGILLTPSIFKQHLASDGHPPQHIQPLFDPEDEQDVKLAYSLLSDIWSLNPAVPKGLCASFAESCKAILIFRKLCYHLIYPYICIDLSLSAQLEHLNAAAHLAIGLYVHKGAVRKFLPNELFLNIMIMIKNAYFCVGKASHGFILWGCNSNSPTAMDKETADRLDGHQMLKDMAAEATEPLVEKVECTIIFGSTSMSKLHALSLAFKHLGSPSSTDHLKQSSA
ncbi:hypothetical protein BT96DRAFT_935041 [Gymnopus androsaceus JB14]|uniref:Uncharacterized protein n=1 Tax=Gymnopus androsaceus JB14 TaxID=1447944 RepID=A0A6A4I7E7_9AGAR|nr:hypothetical protein BT96DRAFT_935041 [Gymnopus androsaceus JB14]